MKKGVKIAFFFGTAAVIGGSIYLYIKKKKEASEELERVVALEDLQRQKEKEKRIEELVQTKATDILSQSLTPLRKNRCGMISSVNTPTESGSQYVGFHVNSPRPNKGDLIKGDIVRIQNTNSVLDAEYEVIKVWMDSKGKVGAVDINHSYPAKGSGYNTQDRVFNGTKNSICY